MKTPSEPQDWAGKWFCLIEELGEFTGIRFGHRPTGGQSEPEWVFMDHSRFDGIGGFAHLLRTGGQSSTLVNLPVLREAKAPGWKKRFWSFLRVLLMRPLPAARWAAMNADWKLSPGAPNVDAQPRIIAFECLAREATARLEVAACKLGVSLNSLLFRTLAEAVTPFLETGSGESLWMIPVNMRGAVRLYNDTCNYSSYLPVAVDPKWDVIALHARVREGLQRLDHWGNWQILNLGRWMGVGAMRKALSADLGKGRRWVGAFSNLGSWDLGNGETEWFFAPPVARSAPFAAGALVYSGRLSLTLQIHPGLYLNQAELDLLLSSWCERLESVSGDMAERESPNSNFKSWK